MCYVRIFDRIFKLSRTPVSAARPFFEGSAKMRRCLWITSVYPDGEILLPYARVARSFYSRWVEGIMPDRGKIASEHLGYYYAQTVKRDKKEISHIAMPDGVELDVTTVYGGSVSRFIEVDDVDRVQKSRLSELLLIPGLVKANFSAAVSTAGVNRVVSVGDTIEIVKAKHTFSVLSMNENEEHMLRLGEKSIVGKLINGDNVMMYLKAEFV